MRAEHAATTARVSPAIAKRTPATSVSYRSMSPDEVQGAGQVPSSARTQPGVSVRGRREILAVHVRSGKARAIASAAKATAPALGKGPR